MSPSNKQRTYTYATIEELIEAIAQLSSFDESKLKEAIVSGKLKIPLQINSPQLIEALNDFASDNELIEASPLPLSMKEQLELIRASLPIASSEQINLQEGASHQNRLEDFHSLLSEIRAFFNEESQKPPSTDSTQNKS